MRIILAGLGNVGRSFLQIVHTHGDLIRDRYGFPLTIVGAADSNGAAYDSGGLPVSDVLKAKAERRSIANLRGVGHLGLSALDLMNRVEGDVLLEATPANFDHGEPGMGLIRSSLGRGIGCVVANKAPLALGYRELAAASDLARSDRPPLRFSACVGGALPTINLGVRDLAGARILGVDTVLNGTCQGILRAMEAGRSFEDALDEMRRRGIAETDPTLDIDGWDQAAKLVILANSVLGRPTVLAEVSVTGIRGVTFAHLRAAQRRGERIVLLGRAERQDPAYDWSLSVKPVSLPLAHPLARMSAAEMGVVYYTDISGTIHATSAEVDAVPTAAAMLRDLIGIGRTRRSG